MVVRDFHPLRVAAIERLCDDAVAVTFDVPDDLAPVYAFRAGQSLTVRRPADPDDERRSYSICAPVGARPRIGVREVPGGIVSAWLVHDLRVGDAVEVAPPSGTFTPDLDAGGRHVMIAAGSGITPVLSIATSLLRTPGAQVSILYGNRRADTVMFAEELADLKDSHPSRLELVHLLSREAREVDLLSGRLDADKLRTLLPLLIDVAAVDHWWLCGPFGMVTDAIASFEETLVTPDSRFDKWLKGDKQALNQTELEGYKLFKESGCTGCHNGAAVGGGSFQKFGIHEPYKTASKAEGRFAVTGKDADRFMFKVPTLRNVELTYPYFHDGAAATLEDAVDTMGRLQLGRKFTKDENAKIVAFLKTLTGKQPQITLPILPPSVKETPKPKPFG